MQPIRWLATNPVWPRWPQTQCAGKPLWESRRQCLGVRIDSEALDVRSTPLCAATAGYSLHANTRIPAGAPDELERLIRYAARPALAEERLSQASDGRLIYRLKRPWRDGTSSVVFESEDLMARLAALVPPPRAHTVHYYGVFAPAAALRRTIVPASAAEPAAVCSDDGEAEPETHRAVTQRPRNYTWSSLMKRVFDIDVLACPGCAGPMKIIAVIVNPEVARRILDSLGLPSRAPPLCPARHTGR